MALIASVWGLVLFFKWKKTKSNWVLFSSSLLFSLAALTKLPFIIFFIVPGVYILKNYVFKKDIKSTFILGLLAIGSSIMPFIWYAIVISEWNGNMVIRGILDNEDSFETLISYILHHLFSSMPEFFINYAALPLFLVGVYFFFKKKGYKNPHFSLLLSLFIVILLYFLFELNAIGKVHDYYLFPTIPILFVIVSYGGYHLLQSKKRWVKTFTVICLITLPLTCYLRTKNSWNTENPGFNADLYRFRNELRLLIPKDELVVAGNDFTTSIFLYYIKRKGWTFDKDQLYNDNLENYINQGAKYLYTDSEAVIKTNSNLIKQKIGQFGSIQVFELQANQ